MQIRKLSIADAAAFRTLRLEAVQNAPASFYPTYDEENAKTVEDFAKLIEPTEHQHVLGAFIDGQLAGVMGFARERRTKLKHKGTIWGVYVGPPFRGHGVSRRLLAETITLAREIPGIQQLQLSVHTENEAAHAVYEALGFKAFGVERDAIYIDGRYFHEVHMALFLEPASKE